MVINMAALRHDETYVVSYATIGIVNAARLISVVVSAVVRLVRVGWRGAARRLQALGVRPGDSRGRFAPLHLGQHSFQLFLNF